MAAKQACRVVAESGKTSAANTTRYRDDFSRVVSGKALDLIYMMLGTSAVAYLLPQSGDSRTGWLPCMDCLRLESFLRHKS